MIGEMSMPQRSGTKRRTSRNAGSVSLEHGGDGCANTRSRQGPRSTDPGLTPAAGNFGETPP